MNVINYLKNTVCLKCGQDLNNYTYDAMMFHIEKHHLIEEQNKQQKQLDEYN